MQDRTFDGLFRSGMTSTSPRTSDWIKLPRSINRALVEPYQPRSAWPEFRFSSLWLFSFSFLFVFFLFFTRSRVAIKICCISVGLYKKICSNSPLATCNLRPATDNLQRWKLEQQQRLGSIFRVTHFSCLYFQLFKVIINLGTATRCTQHTSICWLCYSYAIQDRCR